MCYSLVKQNRSVCPFVSLWILAELLTYVNMRVCVCKCDFFFFFLNIKLFLLQRSLLSLRELREGIREERWNHGNQVQGFNPICFLKRIKEKMKSSRFSCLIPINCSPPWAHKFISISSTWFSAVTSVFDCPMSRPDKMLHWEGDFYFLWKRIQRDANYSYIKKTGFNSGK